jgi:V/A-type H+-transporting ATPase subunit E
MKMKGLFMAEEIRDLIEKINQEGIRAAEEKAQKIEAAARQRSDEILSAARLEAEQMLAAAKERIRREDEKEKILLTQAGRDLLISLRKEITTMLGRIVVSDVRRTLTPEALFKLLSEVIRNYSAGERGATIVLLNAEDLGALEKDFLYKLSEETKKEIVLRPAEEISGGFIISFDSGKSCYDFTDQALADYIGTYLKPKLNQILQEAMKE